jgi:hypothetical protein
MRDALCADLAALGHEILVSVDPRFPAPRSAALQLAPREPRRLARLASRADAVWLIAPETGGLLARLSARLQRAGARLVGSSASAVREVADKRRLATRLRRLGVPHPETRVARSEAGVRTAALRLRLPVVIKPAQGAGCEGVSLVTAPSGIPPAFAAARRASPRGPLLVQRRAAGLAASISLLVSRRRARVLAVNRQFIDGSGSLGYRGGATPFAHPLAARAARLARRVCEDVAGLRGYVGVDVVLGEREAALIELNPRLTTSYLGLRAAFDQNLAGLALAACGGRLPQPAPAAARPVVYSADGRVRRERG